MKFKIQVRIVHTRCFGKDSITEQRGRFSLQPSHISAETESFGLAREFSRLQYVQSLTPPLLFADKKKKWFVAKLFAAASVLF